MTTAADKLLDDLDGTSRSQSRYVARQTIWCVFAALLTAVVWAALAPINMITRGEGTVIPMQRTQVIQSLEGGLISAFHVREGDVVKAGEVLVTIDETRFRSAYLETAAEIATLEAEIARLEAEVMERDQVVFPEDSEAKHETRNNELMLFNARRAKLEDSVASLEEERRIINEQIAITEPLTTSGSVSRVELFRLQQQVAALSGKIAGLRNAYVQEAYDDMVEKKARLLSLQQVLLQRKDQLDRTKIRAQVTGRVNNVNINTVGGVVQPGDQIMEVTPIDDELLIETRIVPRDVAFVTPGMEASVKLTAYDFSIYGDLRGNVVRISEDTVDEESISGTKSYYRVMVRAKQNFLEAKGEQYPIRPGMIANVDIETGRRSVLGYLLRPLLQAQLR
ncbi:HlyD family efflux transporter periplasmic adaptor subunit [Roseovarius sp. MS2]|uniref:HlyD family efflux transporter periplasmic adaptor subunit n=1 Tax=Roseovarius sp. MS2 TaxID=3390728 RepID=UPI003EDBA397